MLFGWNPGMYLPGAVAWRGCRVPGVGNRTPGRPADLPGINDSRKHRWLILSPDFSPFLSPPSLVVFLQNPLPPPLSLPLSLGVSSKSLWGNQRLDSMEMKDPAG